MQDEQNIDQLFRDALKGRSAQGAPESAWDGASAMLDQHFAKGAGWSGWFIAAGVSLLLGAAAVAWWYDQADASLPSSTSTSANENRQLEEARDLVKHSSVNEVNASAPNEDASPTTEARTQADASTTAHKEMGAATSTQGSAMNNATPGERYSGPTSFAKATTDQPTNASSDAYTSSSPRDALESDRPDDTPGMTSKPSSYQEKTTTRERTALVGTKKQDMLHMPPFEVGQIRVNAGGISNRGPLKNEALLAELRKVEVLLEGGVLAASGFENNGPNSVQLGIGWMGGMAIQYHFHQKLFARSGALLHTRDALNSSTLEAQRFDGNLEAVPVRLSYIDIPLEVGYRSHRHSIHFGLMFSPLVSARTALEFTSNNADADAAPVTEGYEARRDGFAGFDVAGSAGYRFQLSERLNAFANIRFGLFDVTDNAYFGTALVDDRNHQLRLGLSYRILHR